MCTKFSVMIEHFAQTFCDLVKSMWTAPTNDIRTKHALSMDEFTELIAYEEREDEFPLEYQTKQRIHRGMHNPIPINPFRVTVRISKMNTPNEKDVLEELALCLEMESPTSFPTTPFSRARIMNRSSDRTIYTMFAARDRLRLEAQSSSKDEYSRNAALQARTSGQCAVFDPNQKLDGLALSCGNHCAMKVGTGHCCSCRSMLPIRANTYVYLEFSVTVSGSQIPTLCVGLAPPDCPLNVMVGSWPRSVGLFSDGQLLVNSRWFPDISFSTFLSKPKVSAGTTMGVLVHLHDPTALIECDQTVIENDIISLSQCLVESPTRGGIISFYDYFTSVANDVKDSFLNKKKVERKEVLSINSGSLISVISTSALDEKTISDTSVAVLIKDQSEETEGSSEKGQLSIKWNINGRQSKYSAHALDNVRDIDSSKAPLYPTVSLLTEDTRVWCRFCEADIVYRDRAVIGAPKGVRVYCLDGSLLLDEKD